MISLFIIESPFQLLSAIEAKKKFQILNAILIVRYSTNKNTNTQINKLLKIIPWEITIKINSTFSIFDSNLKLFFHLLNFQSLKFENIFIGEYRSWVLRSFFYNINAKNYYLLDDGAVSIMIYNQYKKNNTQPYLQPSIFDKFLLQLYKLKRLKTNKDISFLFFSSFNIPIQYNVKNDFAFIKKMMSNQMILHNTTYFFGSPLSEENIISEYTELAYIQEIIDRHVKIGKKLIYIPHRKESEHKKNKIKLFKNIKISTFEFPAEMELLMRQKQPDSIASFYSTVLHTLPAIYSFESVTSYEIPMTKISSPFQNSIKLIYEEYKKTINFIPLEA